jgi:hypothetical protein
MGSVYSDKLETVSGHCLLLNIFLNDDDDSDNLSYCMRRFRECTALIMEVCEPNIFSDRNAETDKPEEDKILNDNKAKTYGLGLPGLLDAWRIKFTEAQILSFDEELKEWDAMAEQVRGACKNLAETISPSER